ncbi:MAG: hypothetical protein H7230_04150 [Candidatus Parcubacteria bacterium]|nr:hypothetical protein [Candidatus Paceibacterota bacterium]
MTRPDLKSLCNNLEQKVSELPRVPYRAITTVGLIATIGYSRVQPLIQANNHRIGGNPTELEYQPSQELNNFDLSGCVQSGQIERTELMDCLKLESMRLIDFEHTYYEANPSPDKTKELATIENVDQYIAKILPRLLPLFDRKLIIQEITNQAKSGQYTPSELISMAGELMDYRLLQVDQLNQNLLRYTGQIYTHGQIGEVNQLREVYKNTFHNFSQERVRVIFAEYFPELKNLSKDTVFTWQDFYNKAVTFKLMNLRARLNLVTSHLKHNSQHTSLEDVEMLGEILGQKDTDEQKKATLDYMAQLHGRGYAKDDNITTRGYLESQVRDVIHRKAMANQGKTPVQKEVEGGLNHGRFIRPFLPAKISFHREYNSDGTYGDVTSLQNVLGSEVQNDNLHTALKIGLARTWSAEGLEALAHSNGTNLLYQRYAELVTDKALDIANSQWTANSNPIISILASGLNLANWPAMNTQSGQYKHIITYNYRPLVDCLFRCTVQEIDPKVYQLFDNKSPNQALPYLSLYLYRYGQGLPVPNVEFYSHITTVTEPALSAFYNLIIKPIEPILNELGLLMAEVALAIILPELIGAIAAESTATRSLRYSGAVTGPRPSGEVAAQVAQVYFALQYRPKSALLRPPIIALD